MEENLSVACRDMIALSLVPGLGPRSIKTLLDEAPGGRDVFAMDGAKLRKIADRYHLDARLIRQASQAPEFGKELSYMRKEGINAVSCLDEVYPQVLREIADAPPVLFLKGDLLPSDADAVAIVGARRCSIYGMRMAEKLGYELAARGITVISGMARGIDSAAHRGALKAGGRTIAVMGSGFRHIYPNEAEGLAEEIRDNGAVVTEFHSDVGPLRENFPRRNRIISGMAKGVVVVEAAVKSGAMITVDFALEQGKEVFAVPGRADSGISGGTNSLIQTGAKLVMGVDDILEELKFDFGSPRGVENVGSLPRQAAALSEEEAVVLAVLEGEETDIDELAEKSCLGRRVSEALVKLQVKGLVKALPGGRYGLSGAGAGVRR